MAVLIACEESQAVTKEFRALGVEAYSCDLLPSSGGHPEWHFNCDVFEIIDRKWGILESGDDVFIDKWDLIVAFPPCTHLSSSGQWAYTKGIKPLSFKDAAISFFMGFVDAECEKIAIENPIGIMSTQYRKPDQIVHPYHFGDKASKSTCLWLKGLPKLIKQTEKKPDFDYHTWVCKKTGVTKRMEKWMYDIRTKPQRERASLASKTFKGIAKAMAEQWTKEIMT